LALHTRGNKAAPARLNTNQEKCPGHESRSMKFLVNNFPPMIFTFRISERQRAPHPISGDAPSVGQGGFEFLSNRRFRGGPRPAEFRFSRLRGRFCGPGPPSGCSGPSTRSVGPSPEALIRLRPPSRNSPPHTPSPPWAPAGVLECFPNFPARVEVDQAHPGWGKPAESDS